MGYEKPSITEVGSVADLTLDHSNNGSHGIGHQGPRGEHGGVS